MISLVLLHSATFIHRSRWRRYSAKASLLFEQPIFLWMRCGSGRHSRSRARSKFQLIQVHWSAYDIVYGPWGLPASNNRWLSENMDRHQNQKAAVSLLDEAITVAY
jgi:hypothetical protein